MRRPSADPLRSFHRLPMSVSRQVSIAQDIGLELDLLETVFHHISDTDDPHEATVLYDGEVPDPPMRHLDHDALHRVLGAACDDLAGHQIPGSQFQGVGTVLGQRHDHVAFRQYAGDGFPVCAHDHGADALQFQSVDDGIDGGLRVHGDDPASLVLENCGDLHSILPSMTAPSDAQRWAKTLACDRASFGRRALSLYIALRYLFNGWQKRRRPAPREVPGIPFTTGPAASFAAGRATSKDCMRQSRFCSRWPLPRSP